MGRRRFYLVKLTDISGYRWCAALIVSVAATSCGQTAIFAQWAVGRKNAAIFTNRFVEPTASILTKLASLTAVYAGILRETDWTGSRIPTNAREPVGAVPVSIARIGTSALVTHAGLTFAV